MQNNFIILGSAFTKGHMLPKQLFDAIALLVAAARQQHWHIVQNALV